MVRPKKTQKFNIVTHKHPLQIPKQENNRLKQVIDRLNCPIKLVG
jgi:hypothetical protein